MELLAQDHADGHGADPHQDSVREHALGVERVVEAVIGAHVRIQVGERPSDRGAQGKGPGGAEQSVKRQAFGMVHPTDESEDQHREEVC